MQRMSGCRKQLLHVKDLLITIFHSDDYPLIGFDPDTGEDVDLEVPLAEMPLAAYCEALARILSATPSLECVDLNISTDPELQAQPHRYAESLSLLWEPLFASPRLRSLSLHGELLCKDFAPGSAASAFPASLRTCSVTQLSLTPHSKAPDGLDFIRHLPKLSALRIETDDSGRPPLDRAPRHPLDFGGWDWCDWRSLESLALEGPPPRGWRDLLAYLESAKNSGCVRRLE